MFDKHRMMQFTLNIINKLNKLILKRSVKNYTKNSVPDDQRLLLTNIPDLIHVDHLVLYLEYLSDEIAVERLDYCRELKNSIAVTFVRAIDLNSVKKRHSNRPKLLNNKIVIFPIYHPDTVVIDLKKSDCLTRMTNRIACKKITIEILELYFSNKRRSGGENVQQISIDAKKKFAYVKFSNFETARLVASMNHVINNKPMKLSLYYDYIGPNPFQSPPLMSFKKIYKEMKNYDDQKKDNLYNTAENSKFFKIEELSSPTSTTVNIHRESTQRNKSLDSVPEGPLLPLPPPLKIPTEKELLIFRQAEVFNEIIENDSLMSRRDSEENAILVNLQEYLEANLNMDGKFNDESSKETSGESSDVSNNTRFSNINPNIDEKTLINNRDEFGQPLVNLPLLDDPILSLTHLEYAQLKGIKNAKINQVYRTQYA